MGYTLKTKPLKSIYKNLGLEDKGKVQAFLDKTVAQNLQKYVSRKSGDQEESIPTASQYGSGEVIIDVPYAHFQAEGRAMVGSRTKRAWANCGEKKIYSGKALTYHNSALRGAHPFERMKADKRDSILRQTANYARRFSNG